MKKPLLRCAALLAALVLLLSACGQAPRAKSLAERYADGELLYVDIGCPADFAIPPEHRLGLESAVKTRLGYPENLLFRYAEIGGELPEDWARNGPEVLLGVQPGEKALDLGDPAQLALAADRIAEELARALGIEAATSGGTNPPTETDPPPTSPLTTTSRPTAPPTTASKPATSETTKQQEKNPQTLQLAKNQVINSDTYYGSYLHFSELPHGLNLEFSTNIGTLLFHRDASYNDTKKFKDGAKEKAGIYRKVGEGLYQLIEERTFTVTDFDGEDEPGYTVFLATDKNDTDMFDGKNYFYCYEIRVGGNNGVSYSVNPHIGQTYAMESEPGFIKLF